MGGQREAAGGPQKEASVRGGPRKEAVEDGLGAGEEAAEVVAAAAGEDAGDAAAGEEAEDLLVDEGQLAAELGGRLAGAGDGDQEEGAALLEDQSAVLWGGEKGVKRGLEGVRGG